MPSYAPMSTKGVALGEVTRALISKGVVELAPLPSPGFYSRLFMVWKTSGSWRPLIDLSHLNHFLASSPFKMETIQYVLLSVRPGDWMVSIDLKEAYLLIPVRLESRKYLRFVAFGCVYQFRALCFGLASAPQVFTRVMAPVSSILHSMGIRLRRYLDDWLIQSSSWEAVLHDLRVVLDLCMELGIVVNPEKSNFVPSQKVLYLGTILDSRTLVASPSTDRIARLLSLGGEFLSSVQQPAACWQSLLGTLSSLTHLVPGGRLRMGSGGGLHSSFLDSRLSPRPPVVVRRASPPARGLSRPGLPGPRLLVRRLGRGLGGSFRSGGCFRPLVSQRGGHFHQRSETSCCGEASSPFPVFSQGLHSGDLRGQLHGGSLSPQFGGYPVSLPQRNSSEDLEVVGASRDHPCSAVHSGQSQCPRGLSLSRPHQSLGSEWTLHRDVFRDLRLRWPVMVDLFATSANHRCSVYFSPFWDPQAVGTDEFLQSWDELQAYAFPPWSIIPRVLVKLRASRGTFLTLVAPYWPQRPWFPELLDLEVAPSVVLPSRPDLLFQPLSGLRHPDLLRLRLHAWKLSGDSLVRQVSPPV